MGDYRDWTGSESPWLREGYFVSYRKENVTYYEHIVSRDLAHYKYTWFESISAATTSGPQVPSDLVMTIGYDEGSTLNRIWQMILGIKGQVYIYVELPTDIHRHGLPKKPKPDSTLREVSHFEEYMSPYFEPSFLTEHIMMKPGFDRINFSAYNPQTISITPELNVFIARCISERIGTERYGELRTVNVPGEPEMTERLRIKWEETLEKLYRRQIPLRPLTLSPVRAPAAEV